MKRAQQNQRRLPTPPQIAHDPEIAICHALELHCELALRSLVAAHPDLDRDEIPYWASSAEPSKSKQAACDIAALTVKLQTAIEAYLRALDIEDQAQAAELDELPF